MGPHSPSAAGALPNAHATPAPAAAPSPLSGHFNHPGGTNPRRTPSALHSNGTTSTAADVAPGSSMGLLGGGGCELPHEWQEVLRNIGADLALAAESIDVVPQAPAGGPSGGARTPMPLPSLVEMAAARGKDQPGLAAAAAAAAAAAGPTPQMATLVPIRLGQDTVGALLLVSAVPQPAAAPSTKRTAAMAAAAAARGAAAGVGTPAGVAWQHGHAGVPPPLPVWSPELLAGVAAALAECCLGPHLSEIVRVSGAALVSPALAHALPCITMLKPPPMLTRFLTAPPPPTKSATLVCSSSPSANLVRTDPTRSLSHA